MKPVRWASAPETIARDYTTARAPCRGGSIRRLDPVAADATRNDHGMGAAPAESGRNCAQRSPFD